MRGQIRYERQLQNTYILLDTVDEAVVKAYTGQVVLRNSIEKFAACKIVNIDGKSLMQYDISHCQDLTTVYSVKKLNSKDIVSIITNLNQIIGDMESYLMDGLQLVLSPEFIYQDLETKQIKFIFDFSEGRHHSDIVRLGEFLIDRVDHEDDTATRLAYYFFENSQNGNYSIERMEEHLEKIENELQKTQEEKGVNNSDMLDSQESHYERDEVENDLDIPVNREDALDYLYGDVEYTKDIEKKERKGIFGRISAFFKEKGNHKKAINVEKARNQSSKKIFGEKNKSKNEKRFECYNEDYLIKKVERYDNDNEDAGHTVYIGKSARDRDYVLLELRKNKEISHKIDSYPFVLGTQKDSVNLYVKDSSVSRIHAKITKNDDAIYIEDMHSTNGTMINDLPLMPHEKNRIKRGDIITLGKTEFEFR